MEINNLKYIVIFGILIIILGSCKTNNNKKHSEQEAKIQLQYKKQQPSRYYVTIHSETAFNISVNEKEINNTASVQFGLVYEFLKDSSLQFKEQLLKITYDNFSVRANNNGKTTEISSENGGTTFNKAEKIFSVIKGYSVWVVLDSTGKVKSTKGNEEILNKISEQLKSLDLATRTAVRSQLQNVFGEKFVKSNVETGLKLLPDSAIYVGDSWSKDEVQESALPLNMHNTYTLKDVKDSVALLEMESDINVKGTSDNNYFGMNVTQDLKGTQTGSFKINLQTGLLLEGQQKAKIKGTFQMQGREIPVTIDIKRNVNVREMK